MAEKSVILLGLQPIFAFIRIAEFQWLKSLLYCWDASSLRASESPSGVSVAEKSVILLGPKI